MLVDPFKSPPVLDLDAYGRIHFGDPPALDLVVRSLLGSDLDMHASALLYSRLLLVVACPSSRLLSAGHTHRTLDMR